MKRLALAAAILVGGAVGAYADVNTWHDITKHPRGDAALQADAQYCTRLVGHDRNGEPTPPAFKRCMLSRGWRLVSTRYQPRQNDDYPFGPTWQTCPFLPGCSLPDR